MTSLLEKWYLARCNGDWEHQYGIKVSTLDNPGWRLKIDLRGTNAESRSIQRARIERTGQNWLEYWIEQQQFHAACGPLNLSETIKVFINWFENGNIIRERR